MDRKKFFSVAALFGIAALSIASARADCPIAGNYSVKGKMTGSQNVYTGDAIIKDRDGGCFVRWLPPNTSEGLGTYADGVLTVNYLLSGHPGVVRYERSQSGVLRGAFWPQGHPTQILGTESLTPQD
jgi:hypothetical protein